MSDERGNEMQAVYTHDEKGKRTDVHRPSEINPGDYEYIKVDEARKALKEGQKVAGPGGVCHHCGKAIVWRVHFRYIPTGDVVTFGYICTEILEMSDNRIDHEMVLLKRAAENARKEEEAKMEREEREIHFRARYPELVKFLDQVDENESFYFLRSLADSFKKWGSLTERQTESALKIKKQREEFLARKVAEALAAPDEMTPVVEGRRVVEGVVLSHKWQPGFGYRDPDVHKMLVREDDYNKVWVTVAQDIESAEYDELKGQRVRFTATVKRSEKDENFGIGKNPRKGEVL